MTATPITSLVVTSELSANRVGPRGVRVPSLVSRLGGIKATRERASSSLSLPAVRAKHPRPAGPAPTW